MREKTIEQHLVDEVQRLGGIAYKFTSPARRNVPDRIVALPGGILAFVELKRPGEKPTKGQAREHERLRDLGQRVYVIDTLDEVDQFLMDMGEL